MTIKTDNDRSFTKIFLSTTGQDWQKLRRRSISGLTNCNPCNTTHLDKSSIHKSVPKENLQLKSLCEQVADNVSPRTSGNKSNAKKEGTKAVDQVLTTLKPILENKLKINFTEAVGKTLNLSPPDREKITKEKQHSASRKEILQQICANDTDNFLASGKSYSEYERERKATFFIPKVEASTNVERRVQQEQKHRLKPKKHHSDFQKYSFDRDAFLLEVKSKEPGSIVIWSRLAKKYDLKINDRVPLNGGQVLMEFARSKGVPVFQFNKHTRISGRDFKRRVRRSIKRIGKSRVSVPTPRTAHKIHSDVQTRIRTGEINIGMPVAPKTFKKDLISPDGTLTEKKQQVYGRKLKLEDIREKEIKGFQDLGILRIFTDNQYNELTMDEVTARFERLGEPCPRTLDLSIERLKQMERTRHLKLWHDHSEILSHSYALFTVAWIYDPANFLTDDEYQTKFPEKKPVSIQSLVEKQNLSYSSAIRKLRQRPDNV
ncbi:Hypothetical predicted protein [Mytilus galloprovincialis]|uniref:Uncharacterized protein n=1 Tax=Mytilus galloprovincialis TaxID=29158 RepID=A0A8B6DWK4_MYTGA|nr:Hypothetical predicted protein [Mytilus galloprovincialis]